MKPTVQITGNFRLFIRRLPGLLALFLMMAMPALAAGQTAPIEPVKARLVAETTSWTPGAPLWVAVHLDIAAGWHTYWRNPGDSGLPTEISWTLPKGFSAGEIAWPAPQRFVVGTIGNYGYSGTADLLIPITTPAMTDAGAPAQIAAAVSWLVCSEICIPGEAKLTLDLPAGAAAAPDPSVAALFAAARSRLPIPAPFEPRFAVGKHDIRLFVPANALTGIDRPGAGFFPTDANLIDAGAEPRQEAHDGGLDLILPRLAGPAAAPGGVERCADGAGRRRHLPRLFGHGRSHDRRPIG